MKQNEQLQCWIHHTAAITGGFLGIYAILSRGDFLGNAQTANLIYLVESLVGRDMTSVGLRIIGVLLYMAGIASTVYLSKRHCVNLHIYSLCVTSAAIFILGLLPEKMNVVIGLYPIFFAMAVQWNSFPGAYGYVSSSIFSTNNIRQVAIALTEYSISHDRKQLHRAKFFAGTLLFFHLGVAFGVIMHYFWGVHSVWFGYVTLLLPGSLIVYEAMAAHNAAHAARNKTLC